MRHQGTDRFFGVEAALRELVRDAVRDELRYLREEIIGWIQARDTPAPQNEPRPDELLTVGQVAGSFRGRCGPGSSRVR
jgi:hypothetical protein